MYCIVSLIHCLSLQTNHMTQKWSVHVCYLWGFLSFNTLKCFFSSVNRFCLQEHFVQLQMNFRFLHKQNDCGVRTLWDDKYTTNIIWFPPYNQTVLCSRRSFQTSIQKTQILFEVLKISIHTLISNISCDKEKLMQVWNNKMIHKMCVVLQSRAVHKLLSWSCFPARRQTDVREWCLLMLIQKRGTRLRTIRKQEKRCCNVTRL